MTPQRTEPKLPAGVGRSPMEAWVSRGSPQGLGASSSRPERPIGLSPLRVHVNPVTEHVDSRAGLPQARH